MVGGLLGGWAVVEGHDDVCAELVLDFDGVFGGEVDEAAVDVGAELDAFFCDFVEFGE